MPLLQFDTSVEMTGLEKQEFAATARQLYSEKMQTGTSDVAVVVRPRSPAELSIGRTTDDPRLLFLDAEIGADLSTDRKQEFALGVMDTAARKFGVPKPNMKVVFTEHEDESMIGYERARSE